MKKAHFPLLALAIALALPAGAIDSSFAPAVVDAPDARLSLPVPLETLAPLSSARLPELPTISNVIVDVRGARGGNGDVAAGYLTATDMIARKSLASRAPTFRFLMDEDAQEILAKMLG